MKKIFIALILSLYSFNGFSAHMVGGEIFYDGLGGNNYRITLKLYRDCFSGGASFDDEISLGVFDSTGTLIHNLRVPFPGSTQVPNTINNPCNLPPNDICVEEAIYVTTVNLPPIAGGYDISYQRCCRNNTISNIGNPGGTGVTYTCHIPGSSIALCNSSPRFNKFPPTFICANVPLNFDHSATDPDGDSLVYEFADPFDGNGQIMPDTPSAPPYNPVWWIPPYTTQNQINAAPAVVLNNASGMITGTPDMMGQWVVGVCVKEYRNKKLISVNTRDFQFNVTACPYIQVSSISSQTTYCFGMTVDFKNSSLNSISYFWDFGDPLLTNDTSSLFAPSFTYSKAGTYTVSLIANPNMFCADTSYSIFKVDPLLKPDFAPAAPQCLIGNSFNFAAAGSFEGSGTFSWSFGPAATPTSSTLKNVSNVTFDVPGNYPVILTVNENGCNASYTNTIKVLPEPTLTYNPLPINGCIPFTLNFSDSTFMDTSVTQVLWDFGDGTTSSLHAPSHTYTQQGVYTVTVSVTTNNICLGNKLFVVPNMVTVSPSPTAEISAAPTTITLTDSIVTFTDLSQGSSNCWIYFGDGDSSNNCGGIHGYAVAGEYSAYQVAENQYGCKDTFHLKIISEIISFWIPNAFTPNKDGKNAIFLPVTMGIQNFHFMIFDRWGNQVFESYDLAKGWDGTIRGKTCQEDIYVWKVEFENAGEHNTKQSQIGYVQLIK